MHIKFLPPSLSLSLFYIQIARTPFVPELASATDTAFFEDFDEDEEEGSSHILEPLSRKSSTFNGGISSEFGNYLPFSGYIFNKEDEEPSTAQKKFRGVVSLLQGQPQLIQQIMGSPTPGSPLLSRNLANLRSPMSSPMLGPSSSSESFSLSPKGSSSSLFLPPTLGAVSNTPSSLSAAVTVATSPSSSSSSLATPATAQGASTIYNAGTNTTVSTGISPDLTLTSSNASLNDSTASIASAASADNQAPSPSPPLPSPKQVTSSPSEFLNIFLFLFYFILTNFL